MPIPTEQLTKLTNLIKELHQVVCEQAKDTRFDDAPSARVSIVVRPDRLDIKVKLLALVSEEALIPLPEDGEGSSR